MTDVVVSERWSGEARVRYVPSNAPELAGFPEVQSRLASPDARLPLVVADGKVIFEGSVSAGLVLAYLKDGQIPNISQGHRVSQVSPEGEEPKRPERGVGGCVGRWWRRLWRSSSS